MRSSPGPQLQPVPARRGLHHAGPVGVDHSMELQPGPLGSMVVHHAGPAFADVHPMFAHVCIRSPNVCTRLHTFTQCLHASAYVHPMFAHVCILLALGSMVVHTSGPGIHRGNCIESPPVGSIEGTASSPGPQGIASCWPGRR